ncbi:hypothetical protein J4732_13510 [Serratia marcescens]|uniref:Uncharacterized protein n=1 Tax=Serratia marcescens TaxID=615 RepID=A0A939NQ16_SERMA|nr:hypothetical protein [Serratia marcescens]
MRNRPHPQGRCASPCASTAEPFTSAGRPDRRRRHILSSHPVRCRYANFRRRRPCARNLITDVPGLKVGAAQTAGCVPAQQLPDSRRSPP